MSKAQDITTRFNGLTLPDAVREIVRDMIPEIREAIFSPSAETAHQCPPQVDGVVSVSTFDMAGDLLVLCDAEGKRYVVQWPADLLARLAETIHRNRETG